DAASTWEPYSGQAVMEFDVAELAREAAPMIRKKAQVVSEQPTADAEDWYRIAIDLETIGSTGQAIDAYENVLRAEPRHDEARINLGRLHHDNGDLPAAERLYRKVLEDTPDSVLGWYNLGVVLDDQGRAAAARQAYEQALKVDEDFADAHFNLARLHERDGHPAQALRHFSRYRALTRES
ncbi:MAG: tetratricopeptide repeat protein, partial [Gammaproteobacteria bacterium]|nr:tetratricopeptide repeat protein [Gammaproteobacteria bacterium]